ncbi:MAG: YveK family protein [Patescibacteria group bacterium]
MEFNEFLGLIKKKKQTIFTLMLVIVMLTVVFSLAQTMKYTVKSRLLVVQNASNNDAYTLSKSNEYLGNLFAEVVYSSSFYDRVEASQYSINNDYFSGTYNQQIEKWQKTVQTKTQGDTGIVEIYVYHPQPTEANKIALAINDILINNNQDYQGGQNIKISIIDQPITSSYPNKPNLPYNVLAALFGSFIISLFYIYIFPEEKHNLYIFSKKKSKKKIVNHDIIENYGKANYKSDPIENTAKQSTENNNENIKQYANNHHKISGNMHNIINR